LYNRINQNNSFTNITNNTNTSAGFSILHTQSFNNLKEFFNFSKKKKVEEIIEEQKLNEEEEENNENDNKSKSDTTFFQPKNIHDKREEIE
ncbi:MAG TPA: hypothetical protein VIK89_09335, partial [Cytophagaceae bacterium]